MSAKPLKTMRVTRKPITEIRRNPDGSLDEVVTWGFVHLEQMSATEWLLMLDTADGQNLRVPIWSKATVKARADIDGPSTYATPLFAAVGIAIGVQTRRINRNRKRLGYPTLAQEGL